LADYATHRDPDVDLSQVTLLPPVIGSSRVLYAGVDYAPHRDEANLAEAQHPTIFTRFADTHLAPMFSLFRQF